MSNTVCVIGNLNIDLIIRQVPHLPVWGQEVVGSSHALLSSGQAGYLAFALARLGIPVSVIANVGPDAFGRQIVGDLRAAGVDVSGVETAETETGISVAVVRADGERAFISNLGCLRDYDESLVERHWDRAAGADMVCLVGGSVLPALSAAASARLLVRARDAGSLTALDPGWDPNGWPPETVAAATTTPQQQPLPSPRTARRWWWLNAAQRAASPGAATRSCACRRAR